MRNLWAKNNVDQSWHKLAISQTGLYCAAWSLNFHKRVLALHPISQDPQQQWRFLPRYRAIHWWTALDSEEIASSFSSTGKAWSQEWPRITTPWGQDLHINKGGCSGFAFWAILASEERGVTLHTWLHVGCISVPQIAMFCCLGKPRCCWIFNVIILWSFKYNIPTNSLADPTGNGRGKTWEAAYIIKLLWKLQWIVRIQTVFTFFLALL